MSIIYSLSTSWPFKSSRDGYELVSRSRKLGFENLEINFQVRQWMFDQIITEVKKGEIGISSLHNICPVTPEMEGVGKFINYLVLSSADESVRKKAVELSEMTMRHAADLGAGCVVFHLGEIGDGSLRREEKDYRKGFRDGSNDVGVHRPFFESLVERGDKIKADSIENIRRSLDYLVPLAEKLKVIIGVENRYYVSQIPNFEEIGFFLDEYRSDYVKFWYDFGHAANKSNLGFENYLEYLKAYRERLAGIHIHDCRGITDHLPPGDGELDFRAIRELLPDNILYVLELKASLTDDDVRRGVNHLKDIGFVP